MPKKVLAVTLLICLAGCTAPSSAERVLSQQGYTDIRAGGYALAECAESDTFATRFTAKAPNGAQVSGAVCSGVLKGATIRFD